MLTERKKRFARRYLVHGNATLAATQAGYSNKGSNARAQGSVLLADPDVVALLEAGQARAHAREDARDAADREAVRKHLQAVARFDPRSMYGPDGAMLPVHQLPAATAYALGSFEVTEQEGKGGKRRTEKRKAWDKNKAMELEMRRLNMLDAEQEAGRRPVQVQVNVLVTPREKP